MDSSRLHFLVVGDEDVGRTPATQVMLLDALTPAAAVQVSSAGLVASFGSPVVASVARQLTPRGLDVEGHRSRPLTRGMLDGADLIVTGTKTQASAVLALDPTALERTFTLRGLARLVAVLPPGDRVSSSWLTRVQTSRGRVAPVHHSDDDLPRLRDANGRTTARVLRFIEGSCQAVGVSYRS